LFHPPTFTGGGQKFRLRAQLGTQRQDYELEFMEPWLFEKHLILDANLFYRYLDFLSPADLYHENDAGTRISLERALGSEQLRGSVGYSFEDVGIIFNEQVVGQGTTPPIPGGPVPVPRALLDERGYNRISKFFTSLAYDTRGPGFLPDRGQRTELSLEAAGPYGGEKDYYKLQLSTAWYLKGPIEGHVLELVGRAGVADAYGNTSQVPFWDRYYLGGMYDLRGFRYHGVSPREVPTGTDEFSREPIGGDSLWFASAEYSVPVIDRLRFAVFYDIGDVQLDPYSFTTTGFDDNWGIGLRLNLPIGPLRLDYGIPIHHDRFNSGSGQFQFGVGYSRPF